MSGDGWISPPRDPGPQPPRASSSLAPFVQAPRGSWTFATADGASAFAAACVSQLAARTRHPSSIVVVVETVYAALPDATIDAKLAQLATDNGGAPS